MASFIVSFSLLEEERTMLDDFKELCRKDKRSLSYGISELIANAMQKEKEKQDERVLVVR